MDHQGAGRTLPTADTRRRPAWPSPDGPAYAYPEDSAFGGDSAFAERATGPLPLRSPGSSGTQPVLAAGRGTQPVLGPAGSPAAAGRTPARGFPPAREQAEAPTESFGPWHTPADGIAVHDDTDFPGPPAAADATGEIAPLGRRRGGRTRRRTRSRVAWLLIAAVIAAGAGFAGYKYLYEPRVNAPVPPTLRLPTNAPGSPGFDKTLGKWQHIGTRSEDPQALTIAGLYPPQFTLNGQSYVRTAASATKTCSGAVFGADLQAAAVGSLQPGGAGELPLG